MSTLLIYDYDFNFKIAERKIISLRYKENFSDWGTFEAVLPVSSPVLKLLSEERFLLAEFQGMQAVIIGYELEDNLKIYGRTPGWLFSKRAVAPFEKNASPAQICRDLVTELYAGAVSLGESVPGSDTDVKYEEITLLDKCVGDVLKNADLGWKLRFNAREKQWIFDIYGVSNRGICLGEGYKNAHDMRICSDILDYAKSAVYISEEGSVIRTNSGDMKCFEAICDSEDKLGKIKDECSLKLKTDVMLGETVRIKAVRGDNRFTMKKRVDSLETYIKNGVKTVCPIFV